MLMDDINTVKRRRVLTEKGKQYRASHLDKKKKASVSRINRKISDIDVSTYTQENDVTVKEELQQMR